ncbi:mitochondrial carrier [Auricularia subglabra TFB-10046 SS5]|nr:mitochondrial carrier [Auricularia subglabra TFB-10046 SS5]
MPAPSTNTDILLAGAFAAFTVDLLVYPLDTVKTRLQSANYAQVYQSNRPALLRGLYQGVGSVIVATLPSSGAFFTTYEGCKAVLSQSALPQPVAHALASSAAELVSCAIITPAEVIKQNAQMVRGDAHNATMQTLTLFRANPRALWQGYFTLAGRNLPFVAMQFPLVEHLRDSIKRHRDHAGTRTGTLLENGLITAGSSGVAGGFAAAMTTPVDVVKTRVMLDAGNGRAPSALSIARGILSKEGIKGLWRGGALRTVWIMLGSALYLGSYESVRLWLGQGRDSEHA